MLREFAWPESALEKLGNVSQLTHMYGFVNGSHVDGSRIHSS